MRHQGQCGGRLLHDEDEDRDHYACMKCGNEWSKRKRKGGKQVENQHT